MKSLLIILLLSLLAWDSLGCCCADSEQDSNLCDFESDWDECPMRCSWYKSLSGDCAEVCKGARRTIFLQRSNSLRLGSLSEARKRKFNQMM